MDNAAIISGFIGVVGGALTTGGVQAAIAPGDRKRATRSAARQLLVELHATRPMLDRLADPAEPVYLFDPERVVAAWEEGRAALAQSPATADYINVHHAVNQLQAIARITRSIALREEGSDDPKVRTELAEVVTNLKTDALALAENATRHAAWSWSERIRDRLGLPYRRLDIYPP